MYGVRTCTNVKIGSNKHCSAPQAATASLSVRTERNEVGKGLNVLFHLFCTKTQLDCVSQSINKYCSCNNKTLRTEDTM